MNRIQIKNHDIGLHRFNKTYLSSYDNKNIYLKMDILSHPGSIYPAKNLMKYLLRVYHCIVDFLMQLDCCTKFQY